VADDGGSVAIVDLPGTHKLWQKTGSVKMGGMSANGEEIWFTAISRKASAGFVCCRYSEKNAFLRAFLGTLTILDTHATDVCFSTKANRQEIKGSSTARRNRGIVMV